MKSIVWFDLKIKSNKIQHFSFLFRKISYIHGSIIWLKIHILVKLCSRLETKDAREWQRRNNAKKDRETCFVPTNVFTLLWMVDSFFSNSRWVCKAKRSVARNRRWQYRADLAAIVRSLSRCWISNTFRQHLGAPPQGWHATTTHPYLCAVLFFLFFLLALASCPLFATSF